MNYDVFISYSRADYLDNNNNIIPDSPIVPILDAFEKNNITYWIDVDGNNATNQYMSKIAKAIKRSNFVLFVSSEKSNHIDSYWPIKEIQLATEKHKKILPFRIDNSEYHEDLILALAGLDVIEYYKNSNQSVKKLVQIVSHTENGHCEDTSNFNCLTFKQKSLNILRLLIIGFVFCFLFFATFATIGACVGYYSNLENAELSIDEAFRNNKITNLNRHTLQCNGDNFSFRYNALTDCIDFNENDSKLFDEVSFENIMMSVSIPIALERVIKVSKRSGNGKVQGAVLIFGTIGVFCGYTVGEYIGKTMAVIKNEKEIEKYVNESSAKNRFKEIINSYNQVNYEKSY